MASYMYVEDTAGFAGVGVKPCKCCRLENGLDLPFPKSLNPDEIQALAKDFSRDILANWNKLNGIIIRYETVVRKRWLKKTSKQREKVLLTAEPAIPRVHRPDFEGFRNSDNRRLARKVTCDATAQLTPYINLEDLSTGNNLLLFINSRGRNSPWSFASTDANKAHLGLNWEERSCHGEYAMMLHGRDTPEEYGKVVKKTSLPDKVTAIHSYNAIYGLLILEIQQRVYNFVLRCVQSVLHDIDTDNLSSVPEEPLPLSLPRWIAPGASESITLHTIESDYREPQDLHSLERLKDLVHGRRLAAEDHIWSLREDPGYFLDSLKEYREYYTRIPSPICEIGWRAVAAILISNALDSLHRWAWLAAHLNSMRPLAKQIVSADRISLRLDSRDEFKMTLLLQVVENSIQKPMDTLYTTIPRSSSLRYSFQPPHDPNTCELKSRCPSPHGCASEWNNKATITPSETRVARNFNILTGDHPYALELHGIRPMVQETHHMLEHDKAARDLVDECLLSDFFDLAVLVDLQHFIDTFQPYGRSWTAAGADVNKKVIYAANKFSNNANILVSATLYGCEHLTALGNPLDGRFHYPAEKRRTAETISQMQSAEKSLKEFWDDLSNTMDECGVDLEHMLKCHMRNDPTAVHTTEDWKDDRATTLLKKPKSSPDAVRAYEAFTTPLAIRPLSKENKKAELLAPAKPKLKTRGTPNDNSHPPARPPTPPPAVQQARAEEEERKGEHPNPILIPRRAFKVLSALLPTSDTISHTPREIAWIELLHAFDALGLIPEKLYGSVWIFKPLPKGHADLKVDVNRSIQFHEPREVRHGGKMDAKMVRRFGSRLKRAFGWEGGQFAPLGG